MTDDRAVNEMNLFLGFWYGRNWLLCRRQGSQYWISGFVYSGHDYLFFTWIF